MPITGQQVYDIAMVLIDEVTELGGVTPDTPKYYQTKAKSIINVLQAELTQAGKEITIINDLSESLSIPDKEALMILPYGVAAHLMLSEDQGVASFFNNRYDELKRKATVSFQPITDVYNTLNGMR
jgi:hypothetical protein